MRRLFALLIAVLLAAPLVMGIQAPPGTHAAPIPFGQRTITGRLVATPQSTNLAQPAAILLQVRGRTYLVRITSKTRIVDSNYNLISLSDLHDKALLQVTGSFEGRQLVASLIRDLSLNTTIALQLRGQLAATLSSNAVCLTNSKITGASVPRAQVLAAAPCPAGQLPLYLTNSTRIQNQSGGPATLGDLKTGDTLQVSAALISNGQITASLIKDLSLSQVIMLQLTGQLASVPGPAVLCLSKAQITSASGPRAQAQTVSPCPSDQLPLFLTSSTKIQNQSGGASLPGDLKTGDTLQVTASLANGQITAALVKDLTLTGFTTVTGQLVATTTNTTLAQPATLLLQAGARTVLVVVTSQTQIVNRDFATITLADLHDRAALRVYGTYNGTQITAVRIRDISLPEETALQVKGQLAAAPNPATVPPSGILCLANAVITGFSAPRAQAQVVSSCPSGQLPLYLNAATEIENQSGAPLSLADLRAGNTLLITGSLFKGQFNAAVITDASL